MQVWLHRECKVAPSEVVYDVAKGLGFREIDQYCVALSKDPVSIALKAQVVICGLG